MAREGRCEHIVRARRGVRERESSVVVGGVGGAPVAKCDYIYILNTAVCLFWTDAKHKSCLVT